MRSKICSIIFVLILWIQVCFSGYALCRAIDSGAPVGEDHGDLGVDEDIDEELDFGLYKFAPAPEKENNFFEQQFQNSDDDQLTDSLKMRTPLAEQYDLEESFAADVENVTDFDEIDVQDSQNVTDFDVIDVQDSQNVTDFDEIDVQDSQNVTDFDEIDVQDSSNATDMENFEEDGLDNVSYSSTKNQQTLSSTDQKSQQQQQQQQQAQSNPSYINAFDQKSDAGDRSSDLAIFLVISLVILILLFGGMAYIFYKRHIFSRYGHSRWGRSSGERETEMTRFWGKKYTKI